MAEEKLLTVRDVSLFLGISEKEVLDLVENGVVPAYKVGGLYLRFKRNQIEEAKSKGLISASSSSSQYTFAERSSDFFYYNDFYIAAFVFILLMLVLIFQLW